MFSFATQSSAAQIHTIPMSFLWPDPPSAQTRSLPRSAPCQDQVSAQIRSLFRPALCPGTFSLPRLALCPDSFIPCLDPPCESIACCPLTGGVESPRLPASEDREFFGSSLVVIDGFLVCGPWGSRASFLTSRCRDLLLARRRIASLTCSRGPFCSALMRR